MHVTRVSDAYHTRLELYAGLYRTYHGSTSYKHGLGLLNTIVGHIHCNCCY